MQDRGRTQPVLAVEQVIPVRPQDLAGKTQRDKAAIAETGIDTPTVGRGGRSRIGVPSFLATGHLLEDGLIPQQAPTAGVERQNPAGLAAVGGGGQKDAAPPNNG